MTPKRAYATYYPAILAATIIAAMYAQYLPAYLQNPWGVVEDDGRHFVAWLRNLSDPTLFTNDPIASYFSALTPKLFTALHYPAVWLGIDVMGWNLIVLAPAIVGLTAFAANRLLKRFFDDPLQRALCIGLIFFLTLNTVTAGLPRSFAYAIFFLCLSLYLERKNALLALSLLLGANIYPVAVIVATAGICMASLIALVTDRTLTAAEPKLTVTTLLAALIGLGIFMTSANDLGATVTLKEAAGLKIFNAGGRTAFFDNTLLETVICSRRGGFFDDCLNLGPWGAIAIYGLLLGFATWCLRRTKPADTRALRLLAGLLLGTAILFILSYAVAFKAHLPKRYSRTAFDLLVPIALTSLMLLPELLRLTQFTTLKRWLSWIFPTAILIYVPVEWSGHYITDRHPDLSAHVRAMPVQTTVAGLCSYTDSLPTFAARSVYVSRELSVPYKKDYYALMSDRVAAQARLFTLPVDAEWRNLLAKTGIDAFIAEPNDSRCWNRFTGSFESMPSWPETTVFEAHEEATQACLFHQSGAKRLIDATCFAERVASPGN